MGIMVLKCAPDRQRAKSDKVASCRRAHSSKRLKIKSSDGSGKVRRPVLMGAWRRSFQRSRKMHKMHKAQKTRKPQRHIIKFHMKHPHWLLITFLQHSRWTLALLGLAGAAAWSQTVTASVGLLGMRQDQLQTSLAGVQAVRSPQRLSSGAVGALRVPNALFERRHFDETLFFAHQKLVQMHLLPINSGTTVYTDLAQSLRSQLGPELASSSSTAYWLMDTASWVSGDADVMLFRSGKPDHPVVRLVIKQRQLADASAL